MRRLTSYEQVLDASGGDPFVRHELVRNFAGPAFALARAVAFVRTGSSGRTGLTAVGPTGDLDALLTTMRETGALAEFPVTNVSLPQHALALHAKHFGSGAGGDWDWMWTTSRPQAFEPERRLIELDDARDNEQLRALLESGNPTTHAHPGEGVTELWVGLREGDGERGEPGTLVACAALQRNHAGVPHLTGITVAPHLRGQQLGLAMTALLTRRAVDEAGVCTLGMFSDNDTARRLYLGLGYRTAQAWASRHLPA